MTRVHRACMWGSLTPPQPRANLAGSLVTALTLRMVLFLSLPSAFRRRWLAVARSLVFLTFATNSLLAQAVSGVGDDAIPIVKGSVRYSVAATWNQWGSVFATDAQGRSKRQPLLGGLATGNTFAANPEKPEVAITIAPGSTLSQVRDAINSADAGVSASLVNDGAGVRLVIRSEQTGLSNVARLTVTASVEAE